MKNWKPVKLESLELIPKKRQIWESGSVDGPYYKSNIYNGSSYTIKRIIVSLVIKKEKKEKRTKQMFERIYATSVNIQPFSTGSFSIKLRDPELRFEDSKGEHLSAEELAQIAGYHLDVKIKEAFGYKGE